MAKRGHGYPQVAPRAIDLAQSRVTAASPRWSIDRALARSRKTNAVVVTSGLRTATRVEDLERAHAWGLGSMRWTDIAGPPQPAVSPTADEITVRRLLRASSMVMVVSGGKPVGVVEAPPRPTSSLAARLERLHGADAEVRLWMLRLAGKLGEAQGQSVYVAGGFVRDVLLGRSAERPADIDLVVEGDGISFGRRLAEETGGHLVVYGSFGTATLEGGATPDGTRLGRVDIAMARRERYASPGALPEVAPASIDEDLARRDFSVNAMAMAVAPSAWGRLHDPWGGTDDVAARRLRVLHPLSLVEDPTRIWRAARYAARLGLRPDQGFTRALALAIRIGRYPALSGQRLQAELELTMDEADPWRVLRMLLDWGAFRLWDPFYRVTTRTRGRLAAARTFLEWARAAHVTADSLDLALIALLLDQTRPVTDRGLRRLALASGPGTAIVDANAARGLARRLEAVGPRPPSRVAEALRLATASGVIAAWLAGGATVRRHIEWFLREGRAERPLSSGEDVVTAGVPRGPLVGQALAHLRDLKLDGRVRTLDQERAAVTAWMQGMATKGELR